MASPSPLTQYQPPLSHFAGRNQTGVKKRQNTIIEMGSYLCNQSTLNNHPFENFIICILPIFENIKVLATLLTLRGNYSLAPKYVGQVKLEPIMLFHAIDGFQLFLALTL